MERSGTLTILGAGASADADYPTAGGLLDEFKVAIQEQSKRELAQREQVKQGRADLERELADSPGGYILLGPEIRPQPTTGEWFDAMWRRFEAAASRLRPLRPPALRPDGRPDRSSAVVYDASGALAFTDYSEALEGEPPCPGASYLETFFAFYDDYMRPVIAATQGDPAALGTSRQRFRHLRELAVETAYRLLSPSGHARAAYLQPLLSLHGPAREGAAIATLNFDLTLEQVACASRMGLWDGFGGAATTPPPGWGEEGPPTLRELWAAAAEAGEEFIGFNDAPGDANILLKLHGSLGWYAVEEGDGDIASRDELRHNAAYQYFRLSYDHLLGTGVPDAIGRLVPRRKAGAVWIRPYLAFARALKALPDRLSLSLTATLAQLLDHAAAVLVIGYSWGDPHVNDLILEAVARGATLANVSLEARDEPALALWMHRFPTTFPLMRRRLFMLGGGAKRVLEQCEIELPSGESRELDLLTSLPNGLPQEVSLERTIS